MQAPNGFENRPDPPTELVVMAIVEALEIDFVEINPRPNVVEHLCGTISVRNKAGDEAGGPGLLEHSDRPLAGNQRLIVGADQNLGPLAQCVFDQALWRSL